MRKTPRQAKRDARQLLRICLVDGVLDENRARKVVQQILSTGRAGAWAVATQFERLLKRDNAQHSARVASAAPLSPAVRAEIEANLERMYGRGLFISFVEDPGLIGGVRITAGSDVYDGSVRGGLAAIEGRFDHAA